MLCVFYICLGQHIVSAKQIALHVLIFKIMLCVAKDFILEMTKC